MNQSFRKKKRLVRRTDIKKKKEKNGTLYCVRRLCRRSRTPYRIVIAIKERNEKEERERDRPCVYCLIRVSLIKRSNRACYVSYMKIPFNESRDEEPLKEFLHEKVRKVLLLLIIKRGMP